MAREQSTLLIVDVQRRFKPSKKLIRGIEKLLPTYTHIFATQFIDGNQLFQKILKAKRGRPTLALDLPRQSRIFKKTGYGIPQTLIAELKRKRIREIDVCGVETDACILAACFALWDNGIRPNVLHAAMETHAGPSYKRAGRRILQRQFSS